MRHVSLILQAHQANCTVLIVYYGNNDTLALIIKLRGEQPSLRVIESSMKRSAGAGGQPARTSQAEYDSWRAAGIIPSGFQSTVVLLEACSVA